MPAQDQKHPGVFKRGAKWWIRIPTGEPKKYHRESVGTFEQAVAEYRKRMALLHPSASLRDAMLRFLATRTSTNKAYESHSRYFDKQYPGVGLEAFAQLDSLRQYVAADLEAGYAKRTINHRLAFLSKVFSKAIEDQLLLENVIGGKGRGRLEFLHVPKTRPRPLRPEEQEQVRASMRPHIYERVEFAIHTGLRRKEQVSIRWEDWCGNMLWIAPAKTGEGRWIALNETAQAILRKRMAEGYQKPFPLTPKGLSATFNLLMKQLGISASWHKLRGTHATRCSEHGASMRAVQRQLGHGSLAVTEIYTAVEDEQLCRTVRLLDKPSRKRVPCRRRGVSG